MSETIKIFISSSIKFETPRSDIRHFFDTKNKDYHTKGLFFETVVCEDFDNVFGTPSQAQYNEILKTCDYLLLFFSHRVGMYTREELLASGLTPKNTYIYELPYDPQLEASVADPASVAEFKALLHEHGYFLNRARNVDQLLLKFNTSMERNHLLNLIPDPVMKDQFFLSSRFYYLNRKNPLAYFSAAVKKQEKNSCSLFFYKGTRKDQPNYYNYRLDESLNGTNLNLSHSCSYINVGNVFSMSEDPEKWLIRFLADFNKIYRLKFSLGSDYSSPGEFIKALYDLLKYNGIDHLVIPFSLPGRLVLDNETMVRNIISFLNLFDFRKNNDTGIYLHFVFNIDVDNEKDTLFCQEVSKVFNITDYTVLGKITGDDLDEWSSHFSDNVNRQMRLVENITACMQDLGSALPAPMADVYDAVELMINKIETK